MPMHRFLFALALSAFWSQAQPLLAADYPTASVRLLVPYGPGSGPDIAARIVAEGLKQATGQAFVVENKVGAGGQICLEETARSKPDGHTVMIGDLNTNALLTATMGPKMSIDVRTALIPVTQITEAQTALFITTTNYPPTSLKEMIEFSRGKRFIYTSGGVGTYNHVDMLVFTRNAGIQGTHVPSRNTADSQQMLIRGEAQGAMNTLATMMPLVKDGKLRPVAVSGSARAAAVPDVPTYAEAGYANSGRSLWQAAFVPAGTPTETVDALFALMQKVVRSEATQAALQKANLLPAPSESRQQFTAFVDSEIERLKKVVAENNVSIQ
jgi:tripartite-type tricarboxylate transporter receptor subunit TctC